MPANKLTPREALEEMQKVMDNDTRYPMGRGELRSDIIDILSRVEPETPLFEPAIQALAMDMHAHVDDMIQQIVNLGRVEPEPSQESVEEVARWLDKELTAYFYAWPKEHIELLARAVLERFGRKS